MTALSTMSASKEYRALMSSVFAQNQGDQPEFVTMKCPRRQKPLKKEPWDKDILKLMRSYAVSLTDFIQDGFDAPEIQPPLDPTAQMLQAQFLALEPFASMSVEARSQVTVAIQIPTWLISSPYACDFQEAAEATFGRAIGLENPSSSAYTALGYELCRVSREEYDCDGPGRLATFEYDGRLAIASIIKTQFSILYTQYSTLNSSSPLELSKWITSFLQRNTPDMITVAGSDVDKTTFQKALTLSNAVDQIQAHDTVEPGEILVTGAAQVAKDALENQHPDCGELDECLVIRAEADNLAGKYVWPKHKKWPATNNRHWKEWKQSPRPRTDQFCSIQLPIYDEDGLVMCQ